MRTAVLAEIVEYAGSVLEVNPAARRDFELLMERVDDKFDVQGMKREDEIEVERAIGAKFFPEGA